MLTERMRTIHLFVQRYSDRHGRAPTFEEIMDGTGIWNKGYVNRTLRRLEERGFIRRIPAKPRAIEILRRIEPIKAYHRPIYCPECDGDVIPAGTPPVCPTHGRVLTVAAE